MGISATLPNVQPSAACTRGAGNTELIAVAPKYASKNGVRVGQSMPRFCSDASTPSKYWRLRARTGVGPAIPVIDFLQRVWRILIA
jgi:hypothetical protein